MSETIEIPARPGLRDAEALLARLRDMAPGVALTFDARAVEDVPAAYALVLASLARNRPDDAPKLRVLAPSRGLVDAFSDLGLFQDLMKMEFGQ